jgi:superfamily II DNA/RNA helicase
MRGHGRRFNLRTCGGGGGRLQLAQLPDVIVSTPARLLAHLDAKVSVPHGSSRG